MPSLNLDLDYFTHPKILRLVAQLGEAGFVVPIRLWCYVAKHHAATGKLAGYSKEEIERIVEWRGTSGQCVEALVEVKLLEKRRAHRSKSSLPRNAQKRPESYIIHDWAEHAGHIVYYKRRAKSAAAARWGNPRKAPNHDASSNALSNAPTSHLISSGSSFLGKKEDSPLPPHDEGAAAKESLVSSEAGVVGIGAAQKIEEIVKLWNAIDGVKRIETLTQGEAVHKSLNARLKQHPDLEYWKKLFQSVAKSDFLCGRKSGKQGLFHCTLTWVLNRDNAARALQGDFASGKGKLRASF